MIKDLPTSEKPREKALKYGINTLSNRELLALLIRTGIKDKSSLELADELLIKCNGIHNLSKFNNKDLMNIKGIKEAKALELLACFELSRRMSLECVMEDTILDGTKVLINWLRKELGNKTQEEFICVYLNNAYKFIQYKSLFKGTIDSSNVFPRDIVKEGLLCNATKIILVHNHPSGNLTPSKADIFMTGKIIDSCNMVNIEVIDHIIITQENYLSFKEQCLL